LLNSWENRGVKRQLLLTR